MARGHSRIAPATPGRRLGSCLLSQGSRRIIIVTLLLARRLLEADLPDCRTLKHNVDPVSDRLVEELAKRFLAEGSTEKRVAMPWRDLFCRAMERRTDRLRYVCRLAFRAGRNEEWTLYPLPAGCQGLFPDSAAPQSRNPQRRPGYACGFAQSFAAKSGANLSANSTKLFLSEPQGIPPCQVYNWAQPVQNGDSTSDLPFHTIGNQ